VLFPVCILISTNASRSIRYRRRQCPVYYLSMWHLSNATAGPSSVCGSCLSALMNPSTLIVPVLAHVYAGALSVREPWFSRIASKPEVHLVRSDTLLGSSLRDHHGNSIPDVFGRRHRRKPSIHHCPPPWRWAPTLSVFPALVCLRRMENR